MSQTITSMIRVRRQYVTDDYINDKGWGDNMSQTITAMIRVGRQYVTDDNINDKGGETICHRR